MRDDVQCVLETEGDVAAAAVGGGEVAHGGGRVEFGRSAMNVGKLFCLNASGESCFFAERLKVYPFTDKQPFLR